MYRKGSEYYATQVFGNILAEYRGPEERLVEHGSRHSYRFVFYGSFPKDELSVFVRFPDRSARFFVGNRYYTGMGPFVPLWDGNSFTVEIPFVYGKGKYSIIMGRGNSFFPQGVDVTAR